MSGPITQNKGEWGELYAFLKLLADGTVLVFDQEDGIATTAQICKVRKGSKLFIVVNDSILVALQQELPHKPHYTVKSHKTTIKKSVLGVLKAIQSGRGTFSIPPAEYVAASLGVDAKSDRSQSKGDLSFSLIRPDTGQESRELPVSVKSWLGRDPSLFNASRDGTRLIYEVTGVPYAILKKAAASGFRALFEAIRTLGGEIQFKKFASDNFRNHLKLIGASEAIPHAVLQHFSRNTPGKTTMQYLEAKHPDPVFFKMAMRSFLRAAALGMTASREWDAEMTASDNYLIVENSGEVKCLLGRNLLEKHLYDCSYLDSPGHSRHGYGVPYELDGNLYLDLNFQVRLKAL